jgi:urease accessory protein
LPSGLRNDGAPLTPENQPQTFEGHLHIEAATRADGRTTLARRSVRAPFHLGKPYWDGRVLQMRIINATAGILAGDRLELGMRIAPGAALLAITPAATRAYVMRRGAAECRQTFTVDPGAWLECAPEPLFPHRDSDYMQSTRLEVAGGGAAYFVEALAPGRTGKGEAWAWRRLRLTLDVLNGGRLALRERFDGSGEDLARLAAFHGMAEAWFGTVVAISPRLADAGDLRDGIAGLEVPGCRLGLTRLGPDCWITRVVAPGSQALRDTLAALRALHSARLPFLTSDLRQV